MALPPGLTPNATDKIIDAATGQFTEIGRILIRTLTAAVGTLAPIAATYLVTSPTGAGPLTNKFNLGALATGYLKLTSAIGIGTPSTVTTIPQADVTGLVAALAAKATLPIAESDVTSLVADLALKAALASPTFTGVPAAPTAAPGTNTTQLASTAFVTAAQALDAPLASPAFTGTPTVPTASVGTNTTQAASTAFVLANAGAPVSQTTTLTGTQNDFALTASCTELRLNNASLVTVTGFAAGVAGQRVTLVSVGAGQVDVPHQNAGSAAANRVINAATAPISLAPGSGTAVVEYDATTARWRLVAHTQGAWITRAFAAGNFAGTGAMTWTVAAAVIDSYLVSGRTLTYAFQVTGTIAGTPNGAIVITLPNGVLTAKNGVLIPIIVTNGGVSLASYAYTAAAGSALLTLSASPAGVNWTAGGITVFGTVAIEVQ